MASHSSAPAREETPHTTQTSHLTQTTRTATIINALKRRAQAVLNDESIDAQDRAIIRYALEINDPWLAELVRRADACERIGDAGKTVMATGETIADTIDFSQTPDSSEDHSSPDTDISIEDRIEALAEMICRAGDEPGIKSAALLVLMATLENATHPKVLANIAKHHAFTRCGELNLYGMVDGQIAVLQGELFAADTIQS